LCHYLKWIGADMLRLSTAKPPRNRIDLSTEELERRWCKRLGRSKIELEAVIAKVGDNAETVMKELGVKRA
jgi:hypothetical protein